MFAFYIHSYAASLQVRTIDIQLHDTYLRMLSQTGLQIVQYFYFINSVSGEIFDTILLNKYLKFTFNIFRDTREIYRLK
jgi:hypothetical protein